MMYYILGGDTMKKQVFLILTLFTLIFLAPTFIEKVSAQGLYEIGTDSLHVREEPTTQSEIVAYTKRGDKVEVSEIKFGWAKITVNGKTGWVASQYIIPMNNSHAVEQPSTQKETTEVSKQITTNGDVVINGNIVNIRSGPSTNHSIIAKAKSGDRYKLISTDGDWKNIQLADGTTAWVAGWLVSDAGQEQQIVATKENTGGSLNGKTIILDAGHGGIDPGSIALNGMFEKTYTLSTTLKIASKLEQSGAKVVLTRADDRYLTLDRRADVSNAFPNSVFISVHYNSSLIHSANGISTFYFHNEDRSLATTLQNQLIATTGLKNRGVNFGSYFVLGNNHLQSILVELGFITNQNDLNSITTDSYQTQVADAITQGLINYFK